MAGRQTGESIVRGGSNSRDRGAAQNLQRASTFGSDGGFSKLSSTLQQAAMQTPDQEIPFIVTYTRPLADQDIAELTAIADQIALDDATVVYTAYLEEGNDVGGIDVGFLVRDSVQVNSVTQLGADLTFVNPITLEDDILHDRPPLLLDASYVCDCDTSFDGAGSDSDESEDKSAYRVYPFHPGPYLRLGPPGYSTFEWK